MKVSISVMVGMWLFTGCGEGEGLADGGVDGGVTVVVQRVDAGDPDAGPGVSAINYATDIQPIWSQYCLRCHGGPPSTLLLTAAKSWSNLVSGTSHWPVCGRFVVSGKPEESLLFFRLTGKSALGLASQPECRRPMPADWKGTATRPGTDTHLIDIDPAAVERVRRWIAEGAAAD